MDDWAARATALDDADPLAAFRARFVTADAPRIYLDGNSLGRMPAAAAQAIDEVVRRWSTELVGGWHHWFDAPAQTGDLLAAAVLGAEPGEVLACDSTTVNLYKLAHAALDLSPDVRAIVTDRDNFPTDRYVLDGIARARGLELREIACDPLDGPTTDDVEHACAAGDVGLVVLSHVAYRSGARADITRITAAARAHGAPVIWDLSHSAGSVPVELTNTGAELAIGCTYKYLNAGPGAPGYLYVRRDLQEWLRSPVQGWFGQADQFEMERPYAPAAGIRRFLAGTPPILGLAAVDVGAALVGEAGIDAIAAKGASLTGLLIDYADAELASLGFEVATPRDAARRGAHVSLRHPQAWQVCRGLIEFEHVVPDFRGPDCVRLGASPLTTTHAELVEALGRMRDLVAGERHLAVDATRSRVT